jgi:hypothetical protein
MVAVESHRFGICVDMIEADRTLIRRRQSQLGISGIVSIFLEKNKLIKIDGQSFNE